MTSSAAVLALVGAELTAHEVQRCLEPLGHRLVAHSIAELMHAAAQETARSSRPDLVLVDLAYTHDPAATAHITSLVRTLDVPAIYIARRAEDLQQPRTASAASWDSIACVLEPQQLSLAIQLALCRTRPAQPVMPPSLHWDHLREAMPLVFYTRRAAGNGGLAFVSDNVDALLGYSAHELLEDAQRWRTCLHPEDRARIETAGIPAAQAETGTDEYRFLHRDGSARWIRDTWRLVHTVDPDERILVGFWLDITDCKRAEEARASAESQLETILDGIREAFYTVDHQWRITHVNRCMIEQSWKSREELIGHNVWEVFPGAVGTDVYTQYHRAMAKQVPVHLETPYGADTWHETSAYPSAHGLLVFGRDITDRKRAELALQQSEARYAQIFHLCPVAMWEHDISGTRQAIAELRAQGVTDLRAYLEGRPDRVRALVMRNRCININQAAMRLLGVASLEEMVASMGQIYLDETMTAIAEGLCAIAEEKPDLECESILGTAQGERRTVLFRLGIPPRNGSFPHMLVGCIDITDRKRAEQKIQQLNQDLRRHTAEVEAINAELESFSYSVSHDLRAPLRAIHGFSEALIEDYAHVLDEQGTSYLDRICLASQRMAQLIDDLLSLSRMTRSSMQIERCNLSAIADEIGRELRKNQPERDVEILIEPGIQVQADSRLLRIAVYNLLGNAWKFTSSQARARIELGTTTIHGRPAYFVRDNGVGFDMAYVHKLFGPFQRLHGIREYEGTGIGLAIVRRIIRRHGGEIWAVGKLGEGATFTLTLS